MAGLGGETGPVGCSAQPNPHRDGTDVSVWGESVSGVGATGICAPSAALRTNPSFLPATAVTSQDGSTRRDDHCQDALERGGTSRLCAQRASHDVSGTDPLVHSTIG